jgi:hypothetical protein
MAKATAKPTGRAIAKTGGGGVPAHLQKVKMSGAGVSTDTSDLLIPMCRILQPMSPEVQKRGATYIKGAEPGDIYIKNAANPVLKGEDGFLFQPCYFSKGIVEWLPRDKGGGGGGGFVMLHKEEPADAISVPNPQNPERTMRIRKSNKNILVETRYHGGFIITDGTPMPAVIPFASSGHTVSKAWMMLMNSKMVSGVKADSWAVYYRFKTKLKTVGPNTWSIFEITDGGEEDEDGLPSTLWVPTLEDYERGAALGKSLASGAQRFDAAAAGDEAADDEKM